MNFKPFKNILKNNKKEIKMSNTFIQTDISIEVIKSKIETFSTLIETLQIFEENIQNYVHNYYDETINIPEDIPIEKKYQMNESVFDRLNETMMRNTFIVRTEKEIMSSLDNLVEITKMFFDQCKYTREQLGNKINYVLDEINTYGKQLIPREEYKNHKEELKQFYIDTEEYHIREEKRKKKRNSEDMKVKTFEKYSERLFLYGEFLTIPEMEAIESMTSMQLNTILFNSRSNNWKLKSSEFFSCLENKSHLIVVIQTIDNQKFGCYITSDITEQGKPIVDHLGYIFKFTDNSISQIQIRDKLNAFRIGNEKDEDLLVIGKNDIVLKKEERKEKSGYKGFLFNQDTAMTLSLSFSKMKQFIPTSITVYQMSYSDEQINDYLKEWTSLSVDSVIFDSSIQSLEKNNEDFSKAILNRSKLIFFIETTNDIQFGCYIDTKIEKLGKYFSDPNTFLFTFRNYSPKKFTLQSHRTTNVLEMSISSDWKLFRIGVDDLCICRDNAPCSCNQSSKSSFDYQGIKNALLGVTGANCFKMKSFKIIQMK